MIYVVTNVCINCKSQDCIDCCVCEPKCPVDAIKPDIILNAEKWIALNQRRANKWPNIYEQGAPLLDADQWADKPVKLALLYEALAAWGAQHVGDTAPKTDFPIPAGVFAQTVTEVQH